MGDIAPCPARAITRGSGRNPRLFAGMIPCQRFMLRSSPVT